jgi:hypothetical protein
MSSLSSLMHFITSFSRILLISCMITSHLFLITSLINISKIPLALSCNFICICCMLTHHLNHNSQLALLSFSCTCFTNILFISWMVSLLTVLVFYLFRILKIFFRSCFILWITFIYLLLLLHSMHVEFVTTSFFQGSQILLVADCWFVEYFLHCFFHLFRIFCLRASFKSLIVSPKV